MLLIKDELFDYYVNDKSLIADEDVMVDFLNL